MSPGRKRVAAVALLLAALAPAQEELACRVSYVTADGLYVDAGTARGLQPGDTGVVRRDGKRIAEVEVVSASKSSARLRLLGAGEPESGDLVYFSLRAREKPAPAAEETAQREKKKDFVPLLERQSRRVKAPEQANIFHGRVSIDQRLHLDGKDRLDYWMTQLASSGSLDRIAGSPWALRWFFHLGVREGDAFEGSELSGARLDLYEFALSRRFEKGGFFRAGRLLPRELSAAGYLDGAQAEVPLGKLRVGAMLGVKPTLDDLSPSLDEPTAMAYATLEAGKRGESYYTGTLGLLAGWFEGDLDRVALLLEQYAALGPRLRVDASAEIDLDVGAAMTRDGIRLSRLDLNVSGDLTDAATLRAGIDHFERLDNRAERASLGTTEFDRGFWRFYVGAGVRVMERLRLDGELTFIDDADDGGGTNWRATATLTDPFGLRGGSVSFTAYSVESTTGDGVGGLLSAYLPLARGRWTVSPSISIRALDSLDLTDVQLMVEYRASSRLSVRALLAHSFGDALDSTLVEIGAVYRW